MTVSSFHSPQTPGHLSTFVPIVLHVLSHALSPLAHPHRRDSSLSITASAMAGGIRRMPVQPKEGEATTDLPWCSTAAAFAAVPDLPEKCPQLLPPLHLSSPTHRWTAEGSCSSVPCCFSLDDHPQTCLSPGLKPMHPQHQEKGSWHIHVPVQQGMGTVFHFKAIACMLNLKIWPLGGREALAPSIWCASSKATK